MRIEQIYYFLEAVKAGSFTQAAKNLYLQQPSLREGIINLENELGQPLLQRTQKGVKLTSYGQYCLPHLQQMVTTYEMLKSNTLPAPNEAKLLRIEASTVFNMRSIIAASDELYCQSGNDRRCRISMNDDKIAVINHVLKKEMDIGLIVYFTEDLNRNQLLMAQKEHAYRLIPLSSCEPIVYMRKNHPLAHKKKLALIDIADYPIIFLMLSNPPIRDLLEAVIGTDHFTYTVLSNLKLVNKYCLEENYLFFSLSTEESTFDDQLTYRRLDQKYTEYYAAVVRPEELDDNILKYIEIVKALS